MYSNTMKGSRYVLKTERERETCRLPLFLLERKPSTMPRFPQIRMAQRPKTTNINTAINKKLRRIYLNELFTNFEPSPIASPVARTSPRTLKAYLNAFRFQRI